jgi:hypothetical protein
MVAPMSLLVLVLSARGSEHGKSRVRKVASVTRYPDNECGKTAKVLCASHTNDAHSCMKCIEENIGIRPEYLVCSLSDVDIICGVKSLSELEDLIEEKALEGNLHEESAAGARVTDPIKTRTQKLRSLHSILGSVSMLLVFSTLAFFGGVV